MEFDATLLSRIQFAVNISFHILFPTITIALAWVLLYFRVRFTISRNQEWEYAYYFWVKVFALTFALGVVSGITMSFQFGTNWPGYMERVGNIAGPLLGYEVLTAFFLEAAFLGIMLFGKERVSNKMHLISSFLVALGTTLSAFWILALNSWMQTPQGFSVENGEYFAKDWFAIIFNPTFPYMFLHTLNASFLTCAFLITGISAWRILQNVDGPATKVVLKTGVALALVLSPLQLAIGDLYGLHVFEHQPAKIAAVEGVWETQNGADFTIIGIPDEDQKKTHFALTLPNMASFILTHDLDGEVKGINEFEDEHPPVAIIFWAFRVMIGIGILMIVVAIWSAWTLLYKKRALSHLQLKTFSWMTFSGWFASLAGWYVAEIGRQPFIVYGQIKTADVVADHPIENVAITLALYLLIYSFLLFSYVGTLRYLSSKPAASLKLVQEYNT